MIARLAMVVLAALAVNVGVHADDNIETALKAARRYRDAQKWHDNFTIEMVSTGREIEPVNEREPSKRVEVTIERVNTCLKISGVIDTFPKQQPKKTLKFKSIVNGKMSMYQAHEIGKELTDVSVSVNVAKKLDANLTDSLLNGSILEGFEVGLDGKCLADIVLESADAKLLGRESIDGAFCLRILAKTRYGSVELWLDEQNGFLPRQYVFKRIADDFSSDGKRIRDDSFYGVGSGSLKHVFVNGITRKMDRVEFGKTASSFFIRKGRILTDDSLSNGQAIRYEANYERMKFDPSPSLLERDFNIDISNGMRINNEDDPNSGVVYEWQDGKVVPASSSFSGAADGKWPRRSMTWMATWAFTGLALLYFALRYIWRYKQKGA